MAYPRVMSDGVKVVMAMTFVIAIVAVLVLTMVPDADVILRTLSLIGFALLFFIFGVFLVVVGISMTNDNPWAWIVLVLPGGACWVVALKIIYDSWGVLKTIWEVV